MANINILRPISLIIGLVFISACTSIPLSQVNDRLNAWKASDIKEVIKYWGVPSRSQQINGVSYAEWINKESEPGNTSVSIGSGTRSRHSSVGIGFTLFDIGGTEDLCSRTVTYQEDGTITEIVWKGTQNFCFELTPDRAEVLAARKAIMEE